MCCFKKKSEEEKVHKDSRDSKKRKDEKQEVPGLHKGCFEIKLQEYVSTTNLCLISMANIIFKIFEIERYELTYRLLMIEGEVIEGQG